MSERYRGKVRAPEFPAGLEWLNTERPLTLQELRGKVVLLDFWTSCCINCHHVLPQLKKLEARFPNELAVIGVHSGKFKSEAETYNVRQAVMRHDLRHPVVNDRQYLLWRAYAVRAWPTILILDPDGYVVGGHSGEITDEATQALGDLFEELIRTFDAKGKIDRTPLDLTLEKHKQPETLLSFPGKLLADEAGNRLFVSDTEHHRVLCFHLGTGKLLAQYGEGEPGKVDGSRKRARFHSPQGLSLRGDALFVADTESHAVRKIALDTGVVTTLAGTGQQATPLPEPGPGPERRLNSPWDVLAVGDTVYIAMAGSHQLWAVDLPTGQLLPFAGDGAEALGDGPRLSAHLAQPSGLATDGERLWFVDSETSSLRSVPLPDGRLRDAGPERVKTFIGEGLFDFGDVDGSPAVARLQHCLGITCAAGRVYVADTYNNKIKVLNPAVRTIHTLSGSGEPGLQDGPGDDASFWEPGGVSAAGDFLYVADTNNHAVRKVDRRTGAVSTLDLTEA